jgi:raffinose/stachyose/melibiose transport system permease protein
MNSAPKGKIIKKTVIYTLALILVTVYIVPLLLIILNSVKSEAQSSVIDLSFPSPLLLNNFLIVLKQSNVLRSFLNGIFISTTVTLLSVILCSSAAFVIQRRQSALTKVAYKYLLAGMIAPFSFIPAIKLLQVLHMYSNYSGLIMVDLAGQIPFTVLLYVGFIKGVPREMDEAAVIDGCKPLRLFSQVVFPMLKPVVSTNVVLTFTAIWNDFSNVLFLVPKSSMWTMPMSVYSFQGFHTFNYGLVCADILIAILPVFFIYLAAQKYIISGMSAGAVKG